MTHTIRRDASNMDAAASPTRDLHVEVSNISSTNMPETREAFSDEVDGISTPMETDEVTGSKTARVPFIRWIS